MKVSLKSFLSLLKYLVIFSIIFTFVMIVITLFMTSSIENYKEGADSPQGKIDPSLIPYFLKKDIPKVSQPYPLRTIPVSDCEINNNDDSKCKKSYSNKTNYQCWYHNSFDPNTGNITSNCDSKNIKIPSDPKNLNGPFIDFGILNGECSISKDMTNCNFSIDKDKYKCEWKYGKCRRPGEISNTSTASVVNIKTGSNIV